MLGTPCPAPSCLDIAGFGQWFMANKASVSGIGYVDHDPGGPGPHDRSHIVAYDATGSGTSLRLDVLGIASTSQQYRQVRTASADHLRFAIALATPVEDLRSPGASPSVR